MSNEHVEAYRRRAERVLKWLPHEADQLSLRALQEAVRTASPKLRYLIGRMILEGRHIVCDTQDDPQPRIARRSQPPPLG
jgi:hypothetical protein